MPRSPLRYMYTQVENFYIPLFISLSPKGPICKSGKEAEVL